MFPIKDLYFADVTRKHNSKRIIMIFCIVSQRFWQT